MPDNFEKISTDAKKHRRTKSGSPVRQPKDGALIAGYVRRSEVKYPPDCITAAQRESYDRELISNYQARIRERASARGHEIGRWYIDLDVSGRDYATKLRTAYIDLCREIKAGGISHVYATETSRMARSTVEFLAFRSLCQQYSVDLDFPNLPTTGNFASDTYLATITGANDQLASDLTSQRIMEHNYQAVKTGQWVGTSVDAWGLRYSRDLKGYVVDERTAPFVRLLFALAIEHGGVAHRVAQAVNAMLDSGDPRAIPAGTLTPPGRGKPAINGHWRSSNILQILRAPRYLRMIDYWPGTESLPRLRIHSPTLIPEVVAPEVVEEVRRLLALRFPAALSQCGHRKAGRMEHTWGGLLFCGTCGARMTPHKPVWWRPGEPVAWVTWRCCRVLKVDKCEGALYVQQRRIARLVGAAFRDWIAGLGLPFGSTASKRRARPPKPHLELVGGEGKDSARQALESIAKQRERVYAAYRRGFMDIDTLGREIEAIAADETHLRSSMEHQAVAEPDAPPVTLSASDVARMAARIDTLLFNHDADAPMNLPLHQFLKEMGAQVYVSVEPAVMLPAAKVRRGGKVTVEVEMHAYGLLRGAGALRRTESDREYQEHYNWRFVQQAGRKPGAPER